MLFILRPQVTGYRLHVAGPLEPVTCNLQLEINKLQNLETMGRGDKKTKKGKIFQGSFGKSRPHKPKKKAAKKSS